MRTLKTLAFATAVVLGATTARAAVLATAPANANYPTQQSLRCQILNLNPTPRTVTMEILKYDGTRTFGPFQVTVPPNSVQAQVDIAGTGAWCRFTVLGSPSTYRAMATYRNASGYTIQVPAQ